MDTSFLYLRFTSLMKYLAGRSGKKGGKSGAEGEVAMQWQMCLEFEQEGKMSSGMRAGGRCCTQPSIH